MGDGEIETYDSCRLRNYGQFKQRHGPGNWQLLAVKTNALTGPAEWEETSRVWAQYAHALVERLAARCHVKKW